MILGSPSPLWGLLFILLFTWCDRDVGDGREGGLSRSQALALAILAGGLLGALVLGPWFAPVGLIWAALRSLGFDEGELDPSTPKAILMCSLRYLAWIPLVALGAALQWGSPLTGALAMIVPALGSIALRVWFGQKTKAARAIGFLIIPDHNATVERGTGALFGAGLALLALMHAGNL